MYKGKKRVKVFDANATVTDTDFSGWLAVNTGTADVVVDKTTLQPGDGLDFLAIHPDVKWDSPIQIVIPTPGGQVTLHQMIYKEIVKAVSGFTIPKGMK